MQRTSEPSEGDNSSFAAGREPVRERPFTVGHRDVWRITLPMTLAFLTTPLLGLTDAAVVGRSGDAVALGGLIVGAQIFDIVFATFNSLRSSTTGLTAQAVGEGNEREIQAVFFRAILLALGVGLVMVLAEQLIIALGLLVIAPGDAVAATTRTYVFVRMFSAPLALANYVILGHVLGRGQGTLGLALQAVINGTNIVMSVGLGLVLGWGIVGVATGTIIGEAAGTALGLFIALRGFRGMTRPSRDQVFERGAFFQMLAVNRDIMIRSFCLLGAFTLFTRWSAGQGALVLAANGILMNLFMIGGFFLDGVATAAEQLVGKSIGARWRPAFDQTLRLTAQWSFLFAALLSLVFLAVGNHLVAFLTTDAAVREVAAVYVVWAALTPLAGTLAFLMDGVYIGATWSGTMRNMMLASLAVFVVAVWLLMPVLDNHGLWLALEIFLGIRGLTLLAMLPSRRLAAFRRTA
ncbi:MATE family efflux transporter [Consotaella aegiceratis]|uniref:MATE family efflux transporter n=1 Tax=Consotaella aegiceratis TaxID=3097961 RepID=UPI002F3F31B7